MGESDIQRFGNPKALFCRRECISKRLFQQNTLRQRGENCRKNGTLGDLIGWQCYILADDGTTATQNTWTKYDQAKCQTFNIQSGTYRGVENKFYWRLVTAVSASAEVIKDEEGNTLSRGRNSLGSSCLLQTAKTLRMMRLRLEISSCLMDIGWLQ